MGDDMDRYPTPWDPGHIDTSTTTSTFADVGGIHVGGTTPQPATDPNEPWVELEPLTKVTIMQMWDLIEALRSSGVAVLGSKAKRSGLFSGKRIDVQLRVPQRMEQDARMIVVRELGVR